MRAMSNRRARSTPRLHDFHTNSTKHIELKDILDNTNTHTPVITTSLALALRPEA